MNMNERELCHDRRDERRIQERYDDKMRSLDLNREPRGGRHSEVYDRAIQMEDQQQFNSVLGNYEAMMKQYQPPVVD